MKLKEMNSPMLIAAIALIVSMAYVFHIKAFYNTTNWLWSWANPVEATPLLGDYTYETDAIQVAILLDVSNSMDGLIEQAKSQLWKIVGELSEVEKDGKASNIEIALYEYGNDYLKAEDGFIRQITPFTNDMDLISEQLFGLRTNGGKEYCGQVIHDALAQLKWATNDGLKMIYIAGNESFTQGEMPIAKAGHLARQKGVLVNTIFCGSKEEGIEMKWKQGANIAEGEYLHIDHNAQTVFIESPYDDRISELNKALNDTYISYGKEGGARLQNMKIQDANATSFSISNLVDRASYKCKPQYSNEKWDLIDAFKKDKTILKDKAKLPEQYKNKSDVEIEAAITEQSTKRDNINAEIADLAKQRRDFLEAQQKTLSDTETLNLEQSILKCVRDQAKSKGYKVE